MGVGKGSKQVPQGVRKKEQKRDQGSLGHGKDGGYDAVCLGRSLVGSAAWGEEVRRWVQVGEGANQMGEAASENSIGLGRQKY